MIWIAIGFICIVVYATVVEPRWLKIRRHLVKGNGSWIVGFVSDIHGNFPLLGRALNALVKEKFSLVVLGGDLLGKVGNEENDLTSLRSAISGLNCPVLAVLGNHDIDRMSVAWKEQLEEMGVTLLNDSSLVLSGLQVVGLAEISGLEKYYQNSIEDKAGYREIARSLPPFDAPNNFPSVLVTHNPDGVFRNVTPEPLVTLAGHTHGGQMIFIEYLPKWIWRLVGYFGYPFGSFGCQRGEIKANNRHLIISNGLGGPSVRIGRRPEVHLISITPAP